MFIIPFKAVAKGRPRHSGGHTYTPKETRDFEELVAKCYTLRGERSYMHGEALYISIVFVFAIPKSYTQKRREAILEGREQYTKKPDIDNLIKSILDGLNGTAYADDKQITGVTAFKRYGSEDRIEVNIWKI